MKTATVLAVLAALTSLVNAQLFLQIGSKTDNTSVYTSTTSDYSLRRLPEQGIDRAAIDGARTINMFSIRLGSDIGRYYGGYESHQAPSEYTLRMNKAFDAGTVLMLQHHAEQRPIPSLTVADVDGDAFTIYNIHNATVQAASIEIYRSSRMTGDENDGEIRLSFASMNVTSGAAGKVTATFNLKAAGNDQRMTPFSEEVDNGYMQAPVLL